MLDFFLEYFFIALISATTLGRSTQVIELTRYIQIASSKCFFLFSHFRVARCAHLVATKTCVSATQAALNDTFLFTWRCRTEYLRRTFVTYAGNPLMSEMIPDRIIYATRDKFGTVNDLIMTDNVDGISDQPRDVGLASWSRAKTIVLSRDMDRLSESILDL